MKKERSVFECLLWASLKCASKSRNTCASAPNARNGVKCRAHTFDRDLWGILPFRVTGDIISHFYAPFELLHKQIVLVQEQYDLSLSEDLIRSDLFPQLIRILEAVDAVVFEEFLIKDTEWGEEDDGVHIIEERRPRGPR